MATLRVAPKSEVATMKIAVIPKPGADFELVEREIPEPGAGQVRIKVKGLRRLPQRRADQRRAIAMDSVSPHSRTRSSRRNR